MRNCLGRKRSKHHEKRNDIRNYFGCKQNGIYLAVRQVDVKDFAENIVSIERVIAIEVVGIMEFAVVDFPQGKGTAADEFRDDDSTYHQKALEIGEYYVVQTEKSAPNKINDKNNVERKDGISIVFIWFRGHDTMLAI